MLFHFEVFVELKVLLAAENFVGELSAASTDSIVDSSQSLIVSKGEKDKEK